MLESDDLPVWKTMLVRGGIPGCCRFLLAAALHFQLDHFWSMVDPDSCIQDTVDIINQMILSSLKSSIWPKAIWTLVSSLMSDHSWSICLLWVKPLKVRREWEERSSWAWIASSKIPSTLYSLARSTVMYLNLVWSFLIYLVRNHLDSNASNRVTYSLNHQLMGLKLRLHQRDQTPAAVSHVFPTGLDDFLRSDPSSGSIGDRSKITGSSKRSCRLNLLSSARSHISFGPCRSSKEASSLQIVCSHQRG